MGDSKGPIATWNQTALPMEVVQTGDFIVMVNNKEGTEVMLQEMKSSADLQLVVNRPLNFEVTIEKKQSLGVDLDYCLTGVSLQILAVNLGPLNEWNKAHPDKEVLAKDRIMSVNGVTGSVKELLQEISNSTELTLGICRMSGNNYSSVPVIG